MILEAVILNVKPGLESDFEAAQTIDQSEKFQGNTVLRGGQAPRVNKSSLIIS